MIGGSYYDIKINCQAGKCLCFYGFQSNKPEKYKSGKSGSSGTYMENRTQKRLYSQCNSPKPQIRTKSSNSEYNAQIHCLYLCKK